MNDEENARRIQHAMQAFTRSEGELYNLIMYSFMMEEGKYKGGVYGEKTQEDFKLLQTVWNHTAELVFKKVEYRLYKRAHGKLI